MGLLGVEYVEQIAAAFFLCTPGAQRSEYLYADRPEVIATVKIVREVGRPFITFGFLTIT
jgi:hypothetical protein